MLLFIIADVLQDMPDFIALNFIDMFHNPEIGFRYRSYPQKAHVAFPGNVFEKAVKILDRAMQEAEKDALPEFAERVKFLKIGLEHAILTTNLTAIFDGNHDLPEDRMKEGMEALRNLIQFRKDNQNSYFSDLLWVTSYWERPEWNLDALSKDLIID